MAKKFVTKVIIAVLILSMMLSLAVACDSSETNTTKPTQTTGPNTNGPDAPETTDPQITTTTPTTKIAYPAQLEGVKEDLEDTVVQMIYVEGEEGIYTAKSLWVDEASSGDIDAVDQQVIDRNNRVFEDLGITVEPFTDPTLGVSGLYTYAKTYFDVQDPGIDIYCGYQYFDLKVALTGNLLNLNTIVNDNRETIIDITQPYWATNYINSITYNDYLYWVTGDLSLRYTGGLYCTFVNLDLYDQFVRNNYDGKSIYDIVNEKRWTMQTMLDMADMVDFDMNNDGKASADDRLGIVFRTGDIMDSFPFSCKISFSSRSTTNGKDTIALALNTDKRAAKLADYIATMFNSIYSFQADPETMLPIFAEGNALFTFDKLYRSSVDLSAMDRFAIIPLPLLDNNQDNYGSGTHDGLTLFGISRYSNCPMASAATLELMAYYSYLLVTPTYIESVLKGSETIHDPESIVMIDKIRAGFDSDFVAAWSDKLGGIVHLFRDKNSCERFASTVKANSRSWTASLTALLNELDAVASKQ
ncbi:MAG: hypothetical protein IKM34_02995 [Clostridia bacterium]|nr:hypothetical protein [Clostridia bacterium]